MRAVYVGHVVAGVLAAHLPANMSRAAVEMCHDVKVW
jgi:hypothetical protein